jgi:putative component of toxin-antitoxin plasmid stabilization module
MAAEGHRREKEGKGGGFWVFYVIGAIVIVILCIGIHKQSDEFANAMRGAIR